MTAKVNGKKRPMSAEEAEKKNPGGGALIEAAARRKAMHEQFVAEVCQQLDIADKLEQLRALPTEERKVWLIQMTFAGLSVSDGAKLLGISNTTANRWFRDNPEEMQKLVRAQLSAESLMEVGPSLKRLQDLRFSVNAETSRKAALDCMAVAGMNPHGPAGGVTVNVNAQNAQFAVMPVAEIEAKLQELAKVVGPQAEKIVDAEVLAVRNHGKRARGGAQEDADPTGSPGADQGPAGGAPPEESQPAD